jgi:hypothetical protein
MSTTELAPSFNSVSLEHNNDCYGNPIHITRKAIPLHVHRKLLARSASILIDARYLCTVTSIAARGPDFAVAQEIAVLQGKDKSSSDNEDQQSVHSTSSKESVASSHFSNKRLMLERARELLQIWIAKVERSWAR